MQDYAQIIDGRVVNTLVLEDPNDIDLPGELIPLSDFEDGRWGIGWRLDNGSLIPPVPDPVLRVEGVPSADGTTPATARIEWPEHPDLTPPATVVFTLNGARSEPVTVVDGVAELEVTASGPGPIDVEAEGQALWIEVLS